MQKMLGRSDTMVRIRGVSIWPQACLPAIKSDGRTTGEWLCIAERNVRDGVVRDEMTVKVEVRDDACVQGSSVRQRGRSPSARFFFRRVRFIIAGRNLNDQTKSLGISKSKDIGCIAGSRQAALSSFVQRKTVLRADVFFLDAAKPPWSACGLPPLCRGSLLPSPSARPLANPEAERGDARVDGGIDIGSRDLIC
jgi:hypothetical protein